VARKKGLYAVDEGPGSELRERVVASVRCDNVVARLCATVVANDEGRSGPPDEIVGQKPLARVSESEIHHDDGTHELGESAPLR